MDCRCVASNQIHHGGGFLETRLTKRKATERPHLLLELRHAAGIEGVMARVVRPRGNLVDQQFSGWHEEELETKQADALEGLNHLHGECPGAGGSLRADLGRHKRRTQNALFMFVLSEGIDSALSIDATGDEN